MAFLRKKHLTNPKRGQFHFRRPSKIFWRAVRGMIPHKTPRGAAAMDRMKVFEGVPAPYDKTKRMVCPAALRVLKLRPDRKVCFELVEPLLMMVLLDIYFLAANGAARLIMMAMVWLL